ncbi:MAG TPA: four helix bundle protein [Ignavibacteria bacterium]
MNDELDMEVRGHNKEFIQFLYVTLSSASEIETQLFISRNQKIIEKDEYLYLNDEIVGIRKMLNKIIIN